MLSVRYDPLFSYVYYVSTALCLPTPPPPHQIVRRLLFSNPLGRTVYSQKDRKTIPYAKFAGQTECIMGDSKIVSGKEVCTHPSHLVLIILLYGAMEVFWPRTFESSGVENTPYVRACIRKTAIISFEFFILPFCRICSLYLTIGTKR